MHIDVDKSPAAVVGIGRPSRSRIGVVENLGEGGRQNICMNKVGMKKFLLLRLLWRGGGFTSTVRSSGLICKLVVRDLTIAVLALSVPVPDVSRPICIEPANQSTSNQQHHLKVDVTGSRKLDLFSLCWHFFVPSTSQVFN